MDFSIETDTAGAKVYELADELIDSLETKINRKYKKVNLSIGIGLRCLPESYQRKSFIRYAKKENFLTIDITISLEKYEKMYKIEQRYHLGKIFLEYLSNALDKYKFDDLDKEEFIDSIKNWAKKIPIKMDSGEVKLNNWFNEEIDWSVDLDK